MASTQTPSAEAEQRWPALESNPEVLEAFAKSCGASKVVVSDVFGLDPELLAMVPSPCFAVILLFPSIAGGREAETKHVGDDERAPAGTFYLEQIPALTNACGTVAMVHAIANNSSALGLASDSPLGRWIEANRTKDFHARGQALDSSDELSKIHLSHAEQGQTGMAAAGSVRHHFLCFTAVEGDLVELDGAYKDAPKSHGRIADGETTLQAAARVIKKEFIEASDALEFAMLAVSSN